MWEMWLVVLGAALALVAQAFVWPALDHLANPPAASVGDQLDQVAQRAAQQGLHVRSKALLLRTDGRRSFVIVGSDPRFWSNNYEPSSDSVSIYDADKVGSEYRLVRRFHFQPAPDDETLPWIFDILRTVDLDGDGNTDVVGTFRSRTSAHPARVPVVIRWDPLRTGYEISALIRVRPRLKRAPWSDGASVWQEIGTHRFSMEDTKGGQVVRGYSTTALAVIPQAYSYSYATVVAAYPFRTQASGEQWQITAFGLDFEHQRQFQCEVRLLPVGSGKRRWIGVTDTNALSAWRSTATYC
jgi:hypothetical protein